MKNRRTVFLLIFSFFFLFATIDKSMAQALLEPEDGKVYHGACLMTYETSGEPIAPYLMALNDSTIQPAVRGLFFTIPGERGPGNSFLALQSFFHAADSVGFIPELSLFFMDKTGSTDSIIALSGQHNWIIDSIITLSKNYGRRMFLRIGGEFNGAGPGWNGGGYHPYLYVTMFRKIVDRFKIRGFRDSIATNWCYEPDAANDFDSVDARGARWYPGDEYVDWFGLDVFDTTHFDLSLPDMDRRSITKRGKAERFLAMARSKGKPVYMSETSAKGINISSDTQDGINDWNSWFAKFWAFIDAHKEIKGFNYINAAWPESAYEGWGDARIQNSTYITQKYREEMKNPKYIHLINPASPVPNKVQLKYPGNASKTDTDNVDFLWYKSEASVINYHFQLGRNTQMNILIVNDSTLTDTTYHYAELELDSFYIWRVRARNSEGWGPWSDMRYFTFGFQDTLFAAQPLTEMGNSTYKNFNGGLYSGNSNIRPEKHNSAGLSLAQSIAPLNKSGRPDSDSGRIVLLSVGMSNCTQEFQRFLNMTDTFKMKNPKLTIVDGAQGGQTAAIIKNPNAAFWRIIDTARLPQARVNNMQVQVIWLKEANANPTQAFPIHANMLHDDLKIVVKLLLNKFPNLKLVYLSSRTYGGYSTTKLNPEPFAYETGFSVKWLIDEQIAGDTSLTYEGANHPAPWLSWGPYLWGNGTNPRIDNDLVWLQEDFVSDGTHPSDKGRLKVANMLLEFFSNDETAKPWFLAAPTDVENKINKGDITISPNPASDYIEIDVGNVIPREAKSRNEVETCEAHPILIFDLLGTKVITPSDLTPDPSPGGEGSKVRVDVSQLAPGVYFVRVGDVVKKFVKM